MRRLTAILFTAILVFNFYGYKLVLSCMQATNDIALENQVDKKAYSDAELISIKTTLHLPYYTGSANFERAYGSITIDGKDYEYVKRRVYNDTLEVLCLPNRGKTALKSAGNELAKAAADGQGNPGKKSGTTVKISLPDFCQTQNIFTASSSNSPTPEFFITNTHLLSTTFYGGLEHPPCSIQPLS